jgi:hypothetical protein
VDEFDILIIIDEGLRNADPPVDELFKRVKDVYQEKVGQDVKINVKEVNDIESPPNKPASQVISLITQKERERIIENSK